MKKINFRLPFLQERAVGIHITNKAIRWLELERFGNRHKIIHTGREDNLGDLQTTLLKLIEQAKPELKFVSVNVDSSEVKSIIIPAPIDLDETDFKKWIENKYQDLIEGGNSDLWIFRHQVLDIDEDQRRCYITAVLKEELEKLTAFFRQIGLRVEIVTTTHLAGAYGLFLSHAYSGDSALIIQLFEGDYSYSTYKNGVLYDRTVLKLNPSDFREIFEEVELNVLSQISDANVSGVPKKIHILKSDFIDGNFNLSATVGLFQKEWFHNVDEMIFLKESGISSDFSIALGLAVKQLYPDLDSINLLEPAHELEIHNSKQKKDAITAVKLQAILLLFLFLSALTIRWMAGVQLDKTHQAATEIQDNIDIIESMETALISEREQFNQVQKIIGDVAQMSFFMEFIGRLASEKLWFREMTIKHDQGKNYITVKGLSVSETEISRFMGHLEQAPEVQQVVLRVSERVQADSFYSSDQYRLTPLTRFEIQLFSENKS